MTENNEDQNQEQNLEIQKQNQNQELSTFDDDDTSGLDLSQINDPQLAKALEERKNRELKDYTAHRKLYPNGLNGERMVWHTPFLKKEEGTEFSEFPTISRKGFGASDILGLVGVFTSVNFGFAYWRDDREDNRPHCQTVAVYTRYGENEKLTVGNLPLKEPYRQPHQAKGKPSEFNKQLRKKKSYMTLYGSRPPLDEEGNQVETDIDPSEPITLDNVDKRFRTCEQCVHFKDHFDLSLDDKGEIPRKASKCGFSGEMKFAVFAIAVLESDINGNKDVVFYRPEDYGIDTLTGPFIASLRINKTMGLQSIGDGDFDIQINKKTNPLAEDVYDFPTYYDLLQSSLGRIDFYEDYTKPIYNFLTLMTPVEVVKDDPNAGGADYIPVFKHLKGGYFDHYLKQHNVSQIAYDLEKAEIRAANNESVTFPTANPVFESLEKEGLNCYTGEEDKTPTEKKVSNETEEVTNVEKQEETPTSNPFKKNSFKYRSTSVGNK